MAMLTYPQVGATRDPVLPDGYRHVARDEPIGTGRAAYERAVEALLGWQMHRGAGLGVRASAPYAAPGVEVVLRLGPIRSPCRVVYATESGFAYGTLPGHPESGEEAFLVELTNNDEVRLRIRAFSRPATVLARLGGPLTRLVQDGVTDRYVRALRRQCTSK